MRGILEKNTIKALLIICSLGLFLSLPGHSASAQTCTLKPQGDADCNQSIDLLDFEIFRDEYAKQRAGTLNISTAKADFNGDRNIDLLDFEAFRSGYEAGRHATPTPINRAFQPTAPYYSTFFYPWYENPNTANADGVKRWSYWDNPTTGTALRHTPTQNWFSNYLPDPSPLVFEPTTELYSSFNDVIINWQLAKMKEAKIEVAINSWWGQADKTDKAFKKIITDSMNRDSNPYPNLRWALYYEKEGTGDPTVNEIVSDLNYIKTNYASQPGMLKIDGKIVIFVSADPSDNTEMVNRWATAKSTVGGIYTVLEVFPTYETSVNRSDSWHQYTPAERSDQQGTHSYSVSPGFWLNGEDMRLCRNVDGSPRPNCKASAPSVTVPSFKDAVQAMVSANTKWKLIQTWNQWGEGTGVEPAQKVNQVPSGNASPDLADPSVSNSNAYIDVLKEMLPPLE